jgi:hypothetical protein
VFVNDLQELFIPVLDLSAKELSINITLSNEVNAQQLFNSEVRLHFRTFNIHCATWEDVLEPLKVIAEFSQEHAGQLLVFPEKQTPICITLSTQLIT